MTDNCGKKKPFERKTLADAVPDIDKYWDKEKNDGKSPSDFSRTSSEKVWTKCPICGTSVKRNVRYTWEADENGVGHVIHCRTCGKRNKENSLVLIVPEIKKYWVYGKNEHGPEYYAISSGKKVHVTCPDCGMERYIPVYSITDQDETGKYTVSSCGNCKLRKNLVKKRRCTVIANRCPDSFKYWSDKNKFTPYDLTTSSRQYIYTFCPGCGKEMKRMAMNTFRKRDDIWYVKKCQKCAVIEANARKGLAQNGSVVDECPEIKEWWDYEKNIITPEELSRGSHYEVYLKCPACHAERKRDIHKFLAVHRDGSLRPTACQKCGYSSANGDPEDNLVKLCPEIEDWWDYERNAPFRPEQFSKGSLFRAYLICPDCGLELCSGIHSLLHTSDDETLVISHNGRCRKYKAMESENNLVTQYPEIEDWWDYEKNYPHKPEEYTLGARGNAHFKCPNCGKESYRRITDAFDTKDLGYPRLFKCQYCLGKKAIPGYNSLKKLNPELAKEWSEKNKQSADEVLSISWMRAIWKCSKCNGEYIAAIRKRYIGDDACPYCGERKVLPGFNSFKVKHPDLLEEWADVENMFLGIDPDQILATYDENVWWECQTCGQKYMMSVKDRLMKQKRGHEACPNCKGRRWKKTYVV